MIQEEKQLLFIDLCARLPYGVKLFHNLSEKPITFNSGHLNQIGVYRIKPYLRPMSSMTEEEKKEFDKVMNLVEERCINAYGKGGYTLSFTDLNDWLNKHHFDYRRLIPAGLALEAPKNMYKTK